MAEVGEVGADGLMKGNGKPGEAWAMHLCINELSRHHAWGKGVKIFGRCILLSIQNVHSQPLLTVYSIFLPLRD